MSRGKGRENPQTPNDYALVGKCEYRPTKIESFANFLLTNYTLYDIMCIQGKGAVKVIGSNGYQVDKGGTEIPLKKSLTNPLTCAIKIYYERGCCYV
jgi:hypothetical protein